MKHPKDEEGFTLTEMLVVITIIVLTLTLSLPYSLKSGVARRLDAATGIVAAKLRETRSLALIANEPRTLTFNFDTNTLARADGTPIYTLPASVRLSLTTADNLIMEHQGGIAFFANGAATGGSLLLSDGDLTRRIAVNWLTGAIVVSAEAAP